MIKRGFEASLFAGALGDAFGYQVEFDSLAEIRRKYGFDGVKGFNEPPVISDDTQMTLFAAEGLILGHGDESEVWKSFLRWYETQTSKTKGDGLMSFEVMFRRQAPGRTCLMSLSSGKIGLPFGTVDMPINDSKGCGGVMRAMPFGFAATSPEEAFAWGCGQAAMTHGHIDGWLPSGILSLILFLSLSCKNWIEIERGIRQFFPKEFYQTKTWRLFEMAIMFSEKEILPDDLGNVLGLGWTGDEALAIAVWAALSSKDFTECLMKSSNHSGDSDSTASIAGNIWGAMNGLDDKWSLEARNLDAFPVLVHVKNNWKATFNS